MGDLNIQLTSIDRSSKQKIIKETQVLNNILDQMNLIDIYRACHPKAAEYTFFSNAHRIFSRIDHILDHKASLDKLKKTKIISINFPDHTAIRVQIYKQKLWQKKKKHMEAEQYATKQSVDH